MICISNRTNNHVGPAGTTFVPDEYLATVGHALMTLNTSMRGDPG